jgi:hypothetical protein
MYQWPSHIIALIIRIDGPYWSHQPYLIGNIKYTNIIWSIEGHLQKISNACNKLQILYDLLTRESLLLDNSYIELAGRLETSHCVSPINTYYLASDVWSCRKAEECHHWWNLIRLSKTTDGSSSDERPETFCMWIILRQNEVWQFNHSAKA